MCYKVELAVYSVHSPIDDIYEDQCRKYTKNQKDKLMPSKQKVHERQQSGYWKIGGMCFRQKKKRKQSLLPFFTKPKPKRMNKTV